MDRELGALSVDMNAYEWSGRDIAGALRYGRGEAGRGGAGVPQEDPEDTPPGDRFGAATRQGGDGMSKVTDLHEEWSRDPDYRAAYDRLGPEFDLSRSLIEARTRAKLTQAELTERMKTTQSVVARLDGYYDAKSAVMD